MDCGRVVGVRVSVLPEPRRLGEEMEARGEWAGVVDVEGVADDDAEAERAISEESML